MSQYLVDTVAFVRYLQDRLTPKCDAIFQGAENGRNHLLVPQIVVGEFLYLALRGRLKGPQPDVLVRDVLHQLTASNAFTISSMPIDAWDTFQELKIPELHDRMIATEAIARKTPLVSNDDSFKDIPGLTTIW